MNILFLGNSHTYFNDMPATCASMVQAATGEDCRVTMLSHSCRNLGWHKREYFELRFNLLYGGYDYCVIQQAAHPFPGEALTLEQGRSIIDLCQKAGVKPVLFMTWAEKRHPENQQQMIDTYTRLAAETGALLAPIGLAWQHVQRSRPLLELYWQDGAHASPLGSYLAAATVCGVITGADVTALPPRGCDFTQGAAIDFSAPQVLEHNCLLPLDEGDCRHILQTVQQVLTENRS